jgi:hypothetical protein
MFKFIGAAVVYGFAIFGLVTWLQKQEKENEHVDGTVS